MSANAALATDLGEDSAGEPAPALAPFASPRLSPLGRSPDEPLPSPRAPRLEIPPYDLAAALTLERELGISHVLAQVLVRRGFGDAPSARAFLHPRESYPPSAFAEIDRALELISAHVAAGSRITIHGDYDVDGVCATAIMVRALRALGANVGWFLPSRQHDGYGVSEATVAALAARGTRLLITVDCGITAVEQVQAARAAGMDVVVTDHHAPRADGELPACPIVHPSVCGYPCSELCGTGVAFKLAQALGADSAEDELELVALATVADLVALQGENRRLVREGLVALARTVRPGLRALMAVTRADPSALDAHVIGFRLAPRINAAGRMTRPDAGLELLLTEDPERASEIAAELDAVNAERRAVEQRIVWEAESQIAELGERSAYVLAADGWHQGVVGIVASRVVERHHRPAFLIALDGAHGTGSGRSIPGFDLLGALHAASEQLERYGGHRAAAGLTVARDRVDALRAAIESHAETVLTPELLESVERIDAVVSGPQLGLAVAEELSRLEPCGIGNPGPRVLVPGARFGDARAMGEGRHARFCVTSAGARARAVAFGCEGRLAGASGEPLDASFRLELNTWQGAVEPRLVLRHAQPCVAQPIEILGEPEDYLAAALAELDAPLPVGEPLSAGLERGALGGRRALEGGALEGGELERIVLERHDESPLAVLRDAVAAAGERPVLAVCADVPRRLAGLAARGGGFSLISYHALERNPALADRGGHLVALDPPACEAAATVLRAGSGFAHLVWGEPELRFVEQMHELEYGLRASLVALYRRLKDRQRVAGQELERLLRGDGPHGRPARLAGRLIRVLAELELVSLDRDLPGLAVASASQTALERSPAYVCYTRRYEDGRRFLTNPNRLCAAPRR